MHVGVSGAVVSRLDYCAGYPGSIQAGAEFPTGIQFWMMTWVLFPAVLTNLLRVRGLLERGFSRITTL